MSTPASRSADWNVRSVRQSGASAMKATSALWPSIAAVSTWQSSASAAFTAAIDRLPVEPLGRLAEEVDDTEPGFHAHAPRLGTFPKLRAVAATAAISGMAVRCRG